MTSPVTPPPDSFAPVKTRRIESRRPAGEAEHEVPEHEPDGFGLLRYLPTALLALVFALIAVIHLTVAYLTSLPAKGWILLGIDAAVGVYLVVDALAMPSAARIHGSRRRGPMLSIRIPETLTIEISNSASRDLAGELRLPTPNLFEVEHDTAHVRLPAGGVARVDFRIRGLRRGLHHFAPLELRAPTPSRLLVRRYRICDADNVPVYPNLKEAKRWELQARRRRREETGLRSSRVLGIGTDFESLREYRPDDDMRQIDWHATARKGTPISRQYRIERNQQVLLAVDVGRLMAAPIGALSRLDIALNAATAMAYVCSSLDDRVGLVAFDDDIRVRLPAQRYRPTKLLAAMSTLEPRRVESDYERAFAICGGMKRALVLLFTDIQEESASGPLLDATPHLVRRHVVVVASVLDPEIHRAATEIPQTGEDAFRQAAARDLLRRRRAITGRLAKLGVDVVEAPAERFSLGLIDTYLRIKARARL